MRINPIPFVSQWLASELWQLLHVPLERHRSHVSESLGAPGRSRRKRSVHVRRFRRYLPGINPGLSETPEGSVRIWAVKWLSNKCSERGCILPNSQDQWCRERLKKDMYVHQSLLDTRQRALYRKHVRMLLDRVWVTRQLVNLSLVSVTIGFEEVFSLRVRR